MGGGRLRLYEEKERLQKKVVKKILGHKTKNLEGRLKILRSAPGGRNPSYATEYVHINCRFIYGPHP